MVAVTTGTGHTIMEEITRACTHLAVILVDPRKDYKNLVEQAANRGLVKIVPLSANLLNCDWLLSISMS